MVNKESWNHPRTNQKIINKLLSLLCLFQFMTGGWITNLQTKLFGASLCQCFPSLSSAVLCNMNQQVTFAAPVPLSKVCPSNTGITLSPLCEDGTWLLSPEPLHYPRIRFVIPTPAAVHRPHTQAHTAPNSTQWSSHRKGSSKCFFLCVWKVKRQGFILTRPQNLLTCLSKETKSDLFLPQLRHCRTVAAFQLWSAACNAMLLAVVTCAPNIQCRNTTHCLPALPPWCLLAGYLNASCAIRLFRDPAADFGFQSAAQRFLPRAAEAKSENKTVSPARPPANE